MIPALQHLPDIDRTWRLLRQRSGWVYAVRSAAFPDLIKVGLTRKDPFQRAKVLSSESVPQAFEVLAAVHVLDRYAAEQEAHQSLARWHAHKEFFTADIEVVRAVLARVQADQDQLLSRVMAVTAVRDTNFEAWRESLDLNTWAADQE